MPAELTPELYRMSMWQVDRFCKSRPWIDKDEVISFVHEQLTNAIYKYNGNAPGAKLSSWLAVATRNGISLAVRYLRSDKNMKTGIYAKKFSEFSYEGEDSVIEEHHDNCYLQFLSKNDTTETKVILNDLLSKRLKLLSPRQKEVFEKVLLNGERFSDLSDKRGKQYAARLSLMDAIYKLETGQTMKNEERNKYLKKRKKRKIYDVSKETIERMYNDQQMTMRDIGLALQIPEKTIWNKMCKMGIKRREKSESYKIKRAQEKLNN